MTTKQCTSSVSSTFCVYPWMEFIIGPGKDTKICCISSGSLESKSQKPYLMNQVTLAEIWNGEGMKDIRRKMIAGEKIETCGHCYYQEDIGLTSYRQSFNENWLNSVYGKEITRRVEKSKKNDFVVDSPPLYLDIRPGNKCNLQCRMCNPVNSSKIYQEQKELLQEKKEFGPLIESSIFNENEEKFHSWHQSPKIWETVYQWLPSIRKLYFTGGEPTLIKKNWELISYLQEKGYSKRITLDFNINCTYIPECLLETFDHFAFIGLNLSIDGHGEVQEYIRYPSKWNILEKNIVKILKRRTETVNIYFSPVVQVYNILYLTQLLRWIDSLQKDYGPIYNSLIICTTPSFLDIAILPQSVRDESLKRIENYQDAYLGHDKFLMESLESIKNILKTIRKQDSILQLNNFFEYTSILDEKRRDDFKKRLPQLHELMYDEWTLHQHDLASICD